MAETQPGRVWAHLDRAKNSWGTMMPKDYTNASPEGWKNSTFS